MPQSLVKILVHIVFSTKDRRNTIPQNLEPRLYGYIAGIIANNQCRLIICGGTSNHIHLLVSIGRADLRELIGHINRDSSKWMKENGVKEFYWQRGYGAFSIGESQVPDLSRYIAHQKEHHGKLEYQDEFRALCRKYVVEIDERYCWD